MLTKEFPNSQGYSDGLYSELGFVMRARGKQMVEMSLNMDGGGSEREGE